MRDTLRSGFLPVEDPFSVPTGPLMGMSAGLPMTASDARHWVPVLEYATLCTMSPQAAGTLARAAFKRRFESAAGPAFLSRGHLLGAVIETAAEWDADGRRSDLREGLRTGADGQDPPSTLLRRGRQLLLRAFQLLPEYQQVLLWHTEVEAEDVAVAASHSGLNLDEARVKLPRVRAQLRAECLQAHLDLAPGQRCLRYSRLIDVSTRRSQVAELVPDLGHHLQECVYCRAAVDQLDQRPGRLPLLLAEAVLGFGAEDYLAACCARSGTSKVVLSAVAQLQVVTAHTPAARPRKHRARRAVWCQGGCLVGAATLVLLAGATLTGIFVNGTLTGSRADTGAAGSVTPSTISTGNRPASGDGARFRNSGTGLCLDISNHDATAVTSTCTDAATQLWRLEKDGLLRSQADPRLCLDSAKAFVVEMHPCTEATGDRAGGFQYVLSDDGLLTPRRDPGLVVAPVRTRRPEGVPVVLRDPDALLPDESERWRVEAETLPR
ncbi:ricin-type beta-trefoil lectin domain protein [Streptomyces sp. NPDC060065]|uniref:RICIN domain-containing protein n=1 Tax=Streptomyces sp. NPDC060065 TaxID=3347050 RepID=UPI0036C46184